MVSCIELSDIDICEILLDKSIVITRQLILILLYMGEEWRQTHSLFKKFNKFRIKINEDIPILTISILIVGNYFELPAEYNTLHLPPVFNFIFI